MTVHHINVTLLSRFFYNRTQGKSWRSIQQKETTEEEEEKELSNDDETSKSELSMLARVKRKRKQRSNSSWEAKKLNCADCGRWFPSSALLDAHSLQHGTKKSGMYLNYRIIQLWINFNIEKIK